MAASRDPALQRVRRLSDGARRTATDHIVESLRESILAGELHDGTELNQVALAEHFKVSRVPVREALRQLQAEGLVSSEAHKRTIVNSMTLAQLMEVFDIRLWLEQYMLGRSIEQMDATDLDRCDALLEQLAAETDGHAWSELNAEFHRALFAPSGCTVATQLAEQLAARTVRYLYLMDAAHPDRVQPPAWAVDDNRRLLEFVRAGDTPAALELVAEHVEATRVRVREVVEAFAAG